MHLDGKIGYDGLFPLKEGDTLTITDKENKIVWSGIVEYEREREIATYDTLYPDYKRTSKAYFNHGIQKGVSMVAWQEWFNKGYRGTVWRNE